MQYSGELPHDVDSRTTADMVRVQVLGVDQAAIVLAVAIGHVVDSTVKVVAVVA